MSKNKPSITVPKNLADQIDNLTKALPKVEIPKNLAEQIEQLSKRVNKGPGVKFSMFDGQDDLNKNEPLEKSVLNTLESIKRGEKIQRLAVVEDPISRDYQTLWKNKRHLLPDEVLKRIANQDSLVAHIWMARSNHIAAFGRELQDRFVTGYVLMPRKGIMDKATKEQKDALKERIKNVNKLLNSCGFTEGYEPDEQETLVTFLYKQARNALIFGRFATEIIYTRTSDGGRVFHSFRPVDAGTIYTAIPHKSGMDKVRERALHYLEKLKNEKLKPEKFQDDEYAFIEVIEGQPRQAFTKDEMLVHNVFPVTDVELNGYPITPIDTAINDIITHLNITNYNKLYFQNGRAARGMIVIKSADISQDLVTQIRNHMNASINNVNNSFRVPVFGVDTEDEIGWQPFEGQGGRDMEFQYLYDNNARTVLSAFQISPDEMPGYTHLSKGTNNQALSESNNEYKLEASRDVGIRPLLLNFQDFINERILPLLDPVVSNLCVFKMSGLDADTAEKESTRLMQDQQLHMDYDEIRIHVEKEPIGKEWGGRFPLNPAAQSTLDKYFTVGQIKEHFFGQIGASQDPKLAYIRDPFWMQYQQFLFQQQQFQMQLQQQQQQAQMEAQQQAQPAPGETEGDGGGPGDGPETGESDESESEIAASADKVLAALGESNG